MDIALHLAIEAVGGALWKCASGRCRHKVHRICVWAVTAVPMSYITVHLVG